MARRRKTNRPKMAPDDPRRKNLMPPIKPGEVRNPTGKNGSEWLKALRDFFEAECTESLPKGAVRREPGDTRFMVALRALFRNAAAGKENSLKLAVEQLAGRPRQHVEMTGKDGAPLFGPEQKMTRVEMQREIERLEALAAADGEEEAE